MKKREMNGVIIQELFKKPVTRDIQGVIVAGQNEDAEVAQELEEYVVTRELQRHFADFFSAYKKSIVGETTKMGVWISGFYGSGKSHFMNILGYLLENREVYGRHALDYFIEDEKITDRIVQADMRLAAETPADVIAFNIAGKSDGSQTGGDRVLRVFLRVFNEMQGFCGQQPFLADLEQKLAEEGKFDTFRAQWQEKTGKTWENSRQKFLLEKFQIRSFLAENGYMTPEEAADWSEAAMKPYPITVEDFAQRVKRYLDTKEKNHHIVFLADEIGQYISGDSALMLNLQTVTEELGKVCRGKVWVVVTSQQDIDAFIASGDDARSKNDFSKIQGRFETRLSLSSADADLVIRKRILEKTEPAAQSLRLLYEQKATALKNRLTFSDRAEKKLYVSDADFAAVYPFIPFQFNLMASSLALIRSRSSSGKDMYESERTMLKVFLKSAVAVKDLEMGSLVPFWRFYDALESGLDHSDRAVILNALENQAVNPEHRQSDAFAVNVLKVLFLIRDVKEIPGTLENITTLMLAHVDEDREVLNRRTADALRVLVQQTLVQKDGELYTFLTNEEQKINREIQNQAVERSAVLQKAAELLFDDILKDRKYQHPKLSGRYAFSFRQTLDDRPYRTAGDAGLTVLTPWYSGTTEDGSLRMISGEKREVLMVLPENSAFLEELRDSLKIEKFLMANAASNTDSYEALRAVKQKEASERKRRAKDGLIEAMKAAVIYVNGDVLRISETDVNSRVQKALGRLMETVYSKLDYIDVAMDTGEIRKTLQESGSTLLSLEKQPAANPHALAEVLDYITRQTSHHNLISIKAVRDAFLKAPCGWVEDDVNWLIARLLKQNDLDFRVSGERVTLQKDGVEKILDFITKKQYAEKLLMEVHARVPDRQKQSVKAVMKDLFDISSVSDDEESLMTKFQAESRQLLAEMKQREEECRRSAYPGLDVIRNGRTLLQSIQSITEPMDFFSTVYQKEQELQELAEDYHAVDQFFRGEQLKIFREAQRLLKIYDDSKAYIVNRDLEAVVASMRAILRMPRPYGQIPNLPGLRQKFLDIYDEILQAESAPVLEAIQADQADVLQVLEQKPYADELRDTCIHRFKEVRSEAESSSNVAGLHSCMSKSNAVRLRLFNEMNDRDTALAKKAAEEARKAQEAAGKAQQNEEPVKPVPAPPVKIYTTKTVTMKSMARKSSWHLENPEDVDRYLSTLRENLLAELDGNTILNVQI